MSENTKKMKLDNPRLYFIFGIPTRVWPHFYIEFEFFLEKLYNFSIIIFNIEENIEFFLVKNLQILKIKI